MSPIVFLLALLAAVTYGYLYLMFTTVTTIFEEQYGFSPGLAGLSYLGFGVGCLFSLVVCGRVANGIAVTHTPRGCFTPESRLPPMVYGCWAIPVGPFWYGWSAQAHAHWIVPKPRNGCLWSGPDHRLHVGEYLPGGLLHRPCSACGEYVGVAGEKCT